MWIIVKLNRLNVLSEIIILQLNDPFLMIKMLKEICYIVQRHNRNNKHSTLKACEVRFFILMTRHKMH